MGDYFSIQAYLQPSAAVEKLLRTMQDRLREADKAGDGRWALALAFSTPPASFTKGIAATASSSNSPTGPLPMSLFPTSPARRGPRCRSVS